MGCGGSVRANVVETFEVPSNTTDGKSVDKSDAVVVAGADEEPAATRKCELKETSNNADTVDMDDSRITNPASWVKQVSDTSAAACAEWTRQISECSATSSGVMPTFACSPNTLIFFDWDDTLFPTSELFSRRRLSLSKGCPDDLRPDLSDWREALHEYLKAACWWSDRVVIVTSSRRPWVMDCVHAFAPELEPFFSQTNGLHVVYSMDGTETRRRSQSGHVVRPVRQHIGEEHLFEDYFTARKYAAMEREAKIFFSRSPDRTWKNIISLGDMPYEHNAIQELAFRRTGPAEERLRAKTILLPSSPTLSEITLRLRFSRVMLPSYLQYDGNFAMDLNSSPDPLATIADGLDMPQLTSVDFPRHAWGRTPKPDSAKISCALHEVAQAVKSVTCTLPRGRFSKRDASALG